MSGQPRKVMRLLVFFHDFLETEFATNLFSSCPYVQNNPSFYTNTKPI